MRHETSDSMPDVAIPEKDRTVPGRNFPLALIFFLVRMFAWADSRDQSLH